MTDQGGFIPRYWGGIEGNPFNREAIRKESRSATAATCPCSMPQLAKLGKGCGVAPGGVCANRGGVCGAASFRLAGRPWHKACPARLVPKRNRVAGCIWIRGVRRADDRIRRCHWPVPFLSNQVQKSEDLNVLSKSCACIKTKYSISGKYIVIYRSTNSPLRNSSLATPSKYPATLSVITPVSYPKNLYAALPGRLLPNCRIEMPASAYRSQPFGA